MPSSPSDTIGPKAASSRLVTTRATPGGAISCTTGLAALSCSSTGRPRSVTRWPSSRHASAISSAVSMSRRTLAWSGRPRTAWAVALRATCQPSRSATATASSTVATGNRGWPDPERPEQLGRLGCGQLAAVRVPASTWFTTRRAATSSVSSIGTAPGRGPASARTRTAPPRRRSRRRRHRSGAAGPVRRWPRRSSTAGGSPGTLRSAVCWSWRRRPPKPDHVLGALVEHIHRGTHHRSHTRDRPGRPGRLRRRPPDRQQPRRAPARARPAADGVHGVPHLLRQGHRVGDDPDSRARAAGAAARRSWPRRSSRRVGAPPSPRPVGTRRRSPRRGRAPDHRVHGVGRPTGRPGRGHPGLRRVSRRVIRENLRGLPMESSDSRQTRVAGSSSQYCITSFAVTSA